MPLLVHATVAAQVREPGSVPRSEASASPDTAAPRQARAVSVPHEGAPTAQAVRTTQPVTVDGRLDESVWMSAPAVTEYWQMAPDEGAPVSRPTELSFLYDDEPIYVGATRFAAMSLGRHTGSNPGGASSYQLAS